MLVVHDQALELVLHFLQDCLKFPVCVLRAYCCTAKAYIGVNSVAIGSELSGQMGLHTAEDQGGCKK